MGVKIRDLIKESIQNISLEDLSGKKIAIDAFNALYQFLSSIRQPNGIPLMDNKGRVTSHLSGLFYRNIRFLEKGIHPVYVFDGKPSKLKFREIERRKEIREKASFEFKQALKEGDKEKARTFGQASSRLTGGMIKESKELLTLMGIPTVEAPSEGEAQASFMAKEGHVWATSSQDYDTILYGANRLIRNLTTSEKRKVPRKNIWIENKPELILFDNV
ncbi:MAG: FEN1 family endonuclease, partial [Candidatus Ranarchaeia archaeon]